MRKGGDPVPLWKLGDTTEPAAFKKLINRMLEAKFLPERDEIRVLPLVLTSTDKIEYGVSYDLALNFSAEKRRYSMYLNGKWQIDNAVPHVPDRIRATPPAPTGWRSRKMPRSRHGDARSAEASTGRRLSPSRRAGVTSTTLRRRRSSRRTVRSASR